MIFQRERGRTADVGSRALFNRPFKSFLVFVYYELRILAFDQQSQGAPSRIKTATRNGLFEDGGCATLFSRYSARYFGRSDCLAKVEESGM